MTGLLTSRRARLVALLVVATAAISALAFRAAGKDLELVSRFDPRIPRVVCGDPHRLRQVIVNLVGNAIKFTASGEIQLSVEVAAADEKFVELHFTIDVGLYVVDVALGTPQQMPDRARDPGQPLGTDHDQRDNANHQQLGKADIEHVSLQPGAMPGKRIRTWSFP